MTDWLKDSKRSMRSSGWVLFFEYMHHILCFNVEKLKLPRLLNQGIFSEC